MTFLPITTYETLAPSARAAIDHQLETHGGRLTSTKATLLGHLPSFDAYMQWYTLKDELVPFIGERAVTLFAFAISRANRNAVSVAFFGEILIAAGENLDDPDAIPVTEAEALLMRWGTLIAVSPHEIDDELVESLEAAFSEKLRLILVAFAGFTVATNVFNSVGRVPLE